MHRNAGDGGRSLPEAGMSPVRSQSAGSKKKNVSLYPPAVLRQQPVQFFHARPRTRTLRMDEHQQGGTTRVGGKLGGGGPLPGSFARDPGGVLVRNQNTQAGY